MEDTGGSTGGNAEEFDLRLDWPNDSVIEPLKPASWSQRDPEERSTDDPFADGDLNLGDREPAVATPDPANMADDAAEDATGEAPTPAEASVDDETLTPADRQRRTFLRTLEPSARELVTDFESLVSTASTFTNVVDGHLRGYLEEVALLETVSAGYLQRYRDGHLRALTELRHLVGDNPAWVQWLAESIKEMAAAVEDAVDAIRDLGQEAREAVSHSTDSARRMTDAVQWLGEQLRSNLAELRNVVAPAEGAASLDSSALADGEGEVERALARLSSGVVAEIVPRPASPGSAGTSVESSARIETQLAQLLAEVRALAERESGASAVARAMRSEARVEQELARLAQEVHETARPSDDVLRSDIARLSEEVQLLRRRLGLRARTPATLDDEQLDAIANAVAAALGGGAERPARRRPLEARPSARTSARSSRRTQT